MFDKKISHLLLCVLGGFLFILFQNMAAYASEANVADPLSKTPHIWDSSYGTYDPTKNTFLYSISGVLTNLISGSITDKDGHKHYRNAFDLYTGTGVPYYIANPVGAQTVLKTMTVKLNTVSPGKLDIHQLGIDVCLRVFDRSQLHRLHVNSSDETKLSWDGVEGNNGYEGSQWKAQFGQQALVTGIVQICMNFAKNLPLSRNEELFDNTVTIEFPGQGLLIPSDSNVLCSTQGGASGLEAYWGQLLDGAEMADFQCDLTFGRLDSSKNSPPVYQSLRTPFFDEMFRPVYDPIDLNSVPGLERIKAGMFSHYAPYKLIPYLSGTSSGASTGSVGAGTVSVGAGTTSGAGTVSVGTGTGSAEAGKVRIDGVWVYDNTRGQEHDLCFNKEKSDGTVETNCIDPPPFRLGNYVCLEGPSEINPQQPGEEITAKNCKNGKLLEGWTQSWTAHHFIHTADGVWNPGDRLSAHCKLDRPIVQTLRDNPVLPNNDCAFFYMVTVPYSITNNQKQYTPLTLEQTITPQDAESYCDMKTPMNDLYDFSQFFHLNDPNESVNTTPWVSEKRVDNCPVTVAKHNRCKFLLGVDPSDLPDPESYCGSQ